MVWGVDRYKPLHDTEFPSGQLFLFDVSVHADAPRSGGCCCGQRALGWVKLAWPVGEKSVVKINTNYDSETRSSSSGIALLTLGSRSGPTGPWRGLQVWFSLQPDEVLPPETFQTITLLACMVMKQLYKGA